MLSDVRLVASLIRNNGGKFVALTGAGCSTESGIPDYRSPGTGLYTKRPNFQPLTIQKFAQNEFEKKRYWGRSIFGYKGLSFKNCSRAHTGLHTLMQKGIVPLLITQNVDGLHHLARHGGVWRGVNEELYHSPDDGPDALIATTASASSTTERTPARIGGPLSDSCVDCCFEDVEGSSTTTSTSTAVANNNRGKYGRLVELHGNIHRVRCMACGTSRPRMEVQKELIALNQPLLDTVRHETSRMRPDADYELDDDVIEKVQLVPCNVCGCGDDALPAGDREASGSASTANRHSRSKDGRGYLRPDVVLFGENVPTPVVEECYKHIDACPVLLCFGTSLHVYSSFRFVKRVADGPQPSSRPSRHSAAVGWPPSAALDSNNTGRAVVIVNKGPTRGDPYATVKVETDSVGEFIEALTHELTFNL